MKAAIINQYGSPEQFQVAEYPKPVAGPDDVVIRNIASSVNPIDCKIRSGMMKDAIPYQMPFIPGWDTAGIIEEVGGNVSNFKVGDTVYAYPEFARNGTYAEFTAVKADQVALKPRTLSFAQAAALPMAAQAAWTAVIATADVKKGQRILIHGAAGALGSVAVQLAKWRGAYVIATASGVDRELVESFGADEVIDYRAVAFQDTIEAVDFVISTVPGPVQENSYGVLKSGGMLIATAQPPSEEKAKAANVRAVMIFTVPSGEVLKQIAELVDLGIVRSIVGTEFPLDEIKAAHELCESGKAKGKIILHIGQP